METNTIIKEDCTKGLRRLEDNSVSITLTSPPYNLSKTGIIQRNSHGKVVKKKVYGKYGDNLSMEEYESFIRKVITDCIRVSKYYVFWNMQILTHNNLTYWKLLDEFKENIKDVIIWHKYPIQPAIQPNCLSSGFEFIIVFAKKEYARNRSFEYCNFNNRKKGQWASNVIQMMSACREGMHNEHNAVFPIKFARWFIDKFTKENDIVLDPFMGTGTTAVACHQTGRQYIGFEIEDKYIQIANKRLNQRTLRGLVTELWFNSDNSSQSSLLSN